MAEMIRKAIAEADANRKSGKRIEVRSPSFENNETNKKK